MNMYLPLGEPHHSPADVTIAVEFADQCFWDCSTIGEMAAVSMKSQSQTAGCEGLDRLFMVLETMSGDEARQFLAENSVGASR